jgi:nicotinamidase-related amidase
MEETMNQAPADRRDPKADHLLTPENAALVLIDYQPEMVAAITSVDHDVLMMNAVALAKTAKAYELLTVLTTVAAKSKNTPTYPELREIFPELEEIDRSTMNPWEDDAFRAAVEATGRRKLIMGGLWTEICLAFPALDALREGFEVYPVIDAVGGTTDEAHQYAVERMIQAGAQPVTWIAVLAELQRDWAGPHADDMREILAWHHGEQRRLRERHPRVYAQM